MRCCSWRRSSQTLERKGGVATIGDESVRHERGKGARELFRIHTLDTGEGHRSARAAQHLKDPATNLPVRPMPRLPAPRVGFRGGVAGRAPRAQVRYWTVVAVWRAGNTHKRAELHGGDRPLRGERWLRGRYAVGEGALRRGDSRRGASHTGPHAREDAFHVGVDHYGSSPVREGGDGR